MLQDFKSVSNHFGTFCNKGFILEDRLKKFINVKEWSESKTKQKSKDQKSPTQFFINAFINNFWF